jgi:hypothetical protein
LLVPYHKFAAKSFKNAAIYCKLAAFCCKIAALNNKITAKIFVSTKKSANLHLFSANFSRVLVKGGRRPQPIGFVHDICKTPTGWQKSKKPHQKN